MYAYVRSFRVHDWTWCISITLDCVQVQGLLTKLGLNNQCSLVLHQKLHLTSRLQIVLPILQYAYGSLRLSDSQIKSLNVCWNNVFRKIFHVNRWESVSSFINGLRYLNFTHMYYLGVFKFMRGMMCSTNHVLYNIVSVNIRGNFFSQQLALFGINLNMPLYVIRQFVYQHCNNIQVFI